MGKPFWEHDVSSKFCWDLLFHLFGDDYNHIFWESLLKENGFLLVVRPFHDDCLPISEGGIPRKR